jgi:hypothetical protein
VAPVAELPQVSAEPPHGNAQSSEKDGDGQNNEESSV